MKQKIVFLLFGFILTLALPSCIKDEVIPLGSGGNTIIKFNEGPEVNLFYSPFETVETVHLFSFRRDANSAAALNQAADVVVELAPELIDDFNTENDGTFEYLPEEIFTFAPDAGVTRNGDQFTIHFEPGEFSKDLDILLDGSLWDLSKKYAIAFKVVDNGGYQVSSEKATSITFVSIKNKWDGVYTIEGTINDVVGATDTHVSVPLLAEGEAYTFELRTISATECEAVWTNYGSDYWYYIPYVDGAGDIQIFGFAINIEFDPDTDNPVAVTNAYGQRSGSRLRSGRLDPSGENTWDNGVMKIKYNMQQEASITPALESPFVRITWDETWTYVEARK